MIKRLINVCFLIACLNSDGLSNFEFSHDGFWHGQMPDMSRVGKRNRVSKCAEDCNKDKTCVAINYYHSGNLEKECYHYHKSSLIKISNKKEKMGSKAYIRCQGSL